MEQSKQEKEVKKIDDAIVKSTVNKWRSALKNCSKKDSWYCSGKVVPPLLQISNVGLHYPLSKLDIANIKTVASIAPFGKGSETVIDETVRKGLQVDKSLVQFTAPESWNKRLQAISAELCNAYNEKDIELVFYKMLLYEEGGHFAAHKDTLRDKNHIASLLISLPVEGGCEGGVLRVNDVSSNVTMEWDGKCEDVEASWCSFYTDCIHELKPLTSGARVVLAYEVHITRNEIQPTKKLKTEVVDAVVTSINDSSKSSNDSLFSVLETALTHKDNVLILLKHMYSFGCDKKNLKGFDRTLYESVAAHFAHNFDVKVEQMKFASKWNSDPYEGNWYNDYRSFGLYLNNKSILNAGGESRRELIENGIIQSHRKEADESEEGSENDEEAENEDNASDEEENEYQHDDNDKEVDEDEEVEDEKNQNEDSIENEENDKGEEDNEVENEDDANEAYMNVTKEEECDDYSKAYGSRWTIKWDPKYQEIYFNTPDHFCLFNSDDFTNKGQWQYQPCSHTGNEGAPEELKYQFYVLTLSKRN